MKGWGWFLSAICIIIILYTCGNQDNDSNYRNSDNQVANSREAIAQAHVGQYIIRNSGEVYYLNQGDINWANGIRESVAQPTYTSTGSGSIYEINKIARSMAYQYTYIKYGRTFVCADYAKEFSRRLTEKGIANELVAGNTYNGTNHGWNYVKTDQGWRYYDITWYDNDDGTVDNKYLASADMAGWDRNQDYPYHSGAFFANWNWSRK